MAVSMTPNNKWLTGDTPDGGTSAILASTIIAVREENISGNTFRTFVTTDQGVSTAYAGKVATAIYGLIKDIVV